MKGSSSSGWSYWCCRSKCMDVCGAVEKEEGRGALRDTVSKKKRAKQPNSSSHVFSFFDKTNKTNKTNMAMRGLTVFITDIRNCNNPSFFSFFTSSLSNINIFFFSNQFNVNNLIILFFNFCIIEFFFFNFWIIEFFFVYLFVFFWRDLIMHNRFF